MVDVSWIKIAATCLQPRILEKVYIRLLYSSDRRPLPRRDTNVLLHLLPIFLYHLLLTQSCDLKMSELPKTNWATLVSDRVRGFSFEIEKVCFDNKTPVNCTLLFNTTTNSVTKFGNFSQEQFPSDPDLAGAGVRRYSFRCRVS